MHNELDEPDVATTAETPEAADGMDEDRDGCELIGGVWVPKHRELEQLRDEDQDRKGWELVRGVWVEKGMSNVAVAVESNLLFALNGHVRAHKLGVVFTEGATYQMFAAEPKLVRRPDVSFVPFARLPGGKVPVKKMQLAPDLAVEVVSPTDVAEAVETKLDEYLRAGVRLVWVVYVPTRNVWAHKPDGTAKLYRPADTLPGDDVLPGFSVPVAELFQNV